MARDEQRKLAEELVGVARQLVAAGKVDETLQRIVDLAVATIERCDHAGLSLVVDDGIQTAAQSDEVSELLAVIQDDTAESPCFDAVRAGEMVESGDLRTEQRWPRFGQAVVQRTDVRSTMAVCLVADDAPLGALNFFSKTVNAFDDDDRSVAVIFAAYAALALETAQEREQLVQAIEHRDIIGQAKGILMAHQGIDDATAFALLRGASNRMHRKLRDVARQIIERERDR